jgi:hypothetical protein
LVPPCVRFEAQIAGGIVDFPVIAGATVVAEAGIVGTTI